MSAEEVGTTVPWGDESSDAELITAARAGDPAAFGALYERHAAAARAVARQYTRSSADAEDVVSDAFARVYSIVRGGGGPDVAFRAYLFTVVRRLAHTRADAGRRVQPTDDMATFESAFGPVDGVDDPALAGFERGVVAKAYGSLPERWQAVLWYTEIERLQPAQVAPLLGLTANGVAALAYRAREGLREAYLQQHLVAAPSEDCRSVNAKLGAYVRGGLARRETAHVRTHLETCETCRNLVLELGDVNHGLRGIIAPLVLGVAGLGALAAPLPVGLLSAAAVGVGGSTAVGSGAAVGGGTAAGVGAATGGGSGVATVGAGSGAASGAAAAGGATATGAATTGAATTGAATAGAATAGAGSLATTAAGSGAVGSAAAGTGTALAGAGSTAGGLVGGAAAGSTVAGATAGTAGALGAGAATGSAGATVLGAAGTGLAGAGAAGAGAAGTAGATVLGATGAAATATGAATAAGVATAGGATALVGAGAASGAAAAGVGGLLAAVPGGVTSIVTAGVVGVSLAVGGALSEPPARPPVVAVAPPSLTAPGGGAPGGPAADGATGTPETDQPGSGLLLETPLLPLLPVTEAPDVPVVPVADDGAPATDPALPPASPAAGPPAPGGDSGPAEPAPTAPLTPAALAVRPTPDIVLVPGTDRPVVITVTNTGQTDATDLRAALVLPPGASVGGSGGTGPWQPCADDPTDFCLASLPGGTSADLSALVSVAGQGTVPGATTIGVQVEGAGLVFQGTVAATVEATPPLLVVAGDAPGPLTVDVPRSVTFAVANRGQAPARDVVATVVLPAGVRWTGQADAPWACAAGAAEVTCRLAELAGGQPGGTTGVSLTLTLVADAAAAGAAGLPLEVRLVDGSGAAASHSVPLAVEAAPVPQPDQLVDPLVEPQPGPPAEEPRTEAVGTVDPQPAEPSGDV